MVKLTRDEVAVVVLPRARVEDRLPVRGHVAVAPRSVGGGGVVLAPLPAAAVPLPAFAAVVLLELVHELPLLAVARHGLLPHLVHLPLVRGRLRSGRAAVVIIDRGPGPIPPPPIAVAIRLGVGLELADPPQLLLDLVQPAGRLGVQRTRLLHLAEADGELDHLLLELDGRPLLAVGRASSSSASSSAVDLLVMVAVLGDDPPLLVDAAHHPLLLPVALPRREPLERPLRRQRAQTALVVVAVVLVRVVVPRVQSRGDNVGDERPVPVFGTVVLAAVELGDAVLEEAAAVGVLLPLGLEADVLHGMLFLALVPAVVFAVGPPRFPPPPLAALALPPRPPLAVPLLVGPPPPLTVVVPGGGTLLVLPSSGVTFSPAALAVFVVVRVVKVPYLDLPTPAEDALVDVRAVGLEADVPLQPAPDPSRPPSHRHQFRGPHRAHAHQRSGYVVVPGAYLADVPLPLQTESVGRRRLYPHDDQVGHLRLPELDHGLVGRVHEVRDARRYAREARDVLVVPVPLLGQVGIDGYGGPAVVLAGQHCRTGLASLPEHEAHHPPGVRLRVVLLLDLVLGPLPPPLRTSPRRRRIPVAVVRDEVFLPQRPVQTDRLERRH